MAATSEGSRRLIAREEDGAKLWIGAAIMIWGGWECMEAEELAIKRLGGKFWKADFGSWKERAAEEVWVQRACCEGGRRQIVPEEFRNVWIKE
jgi:hypothetical protein